MRLELFDVRRRWPRQRTLRDDERGFVNSGILFSLSSSVQFVGLILPSNSHAEIKTRLYASAIFPISGDWDECVTSAHLEWPVWSSSSGNNCHAVHRSLSSGASLKWDLHLVPYYQPSTSARFLLIIGHWDLSHPLSSELQVWSSSSGNNYHAVHRSISSSASLFFTAQWEFLPCLILWAKLYFTLLAILFFKMFTREHFKWINPSPLSPLHTNEAIVQQRLAKVEKITKAYDTHKKKKQKKNKQKTKNKIKKN